MKKWLTVLAAIVLAMLLFGCDHEDTTEFVMADTSEITFEELLSPPYVTPDAWSFANSWWLECGGENLDPTRAEEKLYLEIEKGLREILKGETLYTYIPEGKVRNYDKHVKELLWEQEERLLYLQMGASVHIAEQEDTLVPSHVRLYCLDESRCYLTVGYHKGTIIKSNHYVFYTEDAALVEELFLFAESLLEADLER